jgi:hypothetical protein
MSLKIETFENLSTYFYSKLDEINKSTICPLPQETIFYSSKVLEKYSLSSVFFEQNDEGKLSEKILGQRFLEASQFNEIERSRVYKDIGDTALFLCGYFSSSLNNKIVDKSYYSNIGIESYSRLGGSQVYKIMATSFDTLTALLSILAKLDKSDPHSHLLFNIDEESLTDQEKVILNFNRVKKIS